MDLLVSFTEQVFISLVMCYSVYFWAIENQLCFFLATSLAYLKLLLARWIAKTSSLSFVYADTTVPVLISIQSEALASEIYIVSYNIVWNPSATVWIRRTEHK